MGQQWAIVVRGVRGGKLIAEHIPLPQCPEHTAKPPRIKMGRLAGKTKIKNPRISHFGQKTKTTTIR
jgi:hypothetical protein